MKLCYSISLHGNRGNNSFCLIIGYVCCKRLNILTRMHSSRMRTIRCSSHLGRGCLPRRVSACQGVSAQGVSAWHEGCTPPPRGQTDTCENITFPQLLLRTIKIRWWKFHQVARARVWGLAAEILGPHNLPKFLEQKGQINHKDDSLRATINLQSYFRWDDGELFIPSRRNFSLCLPRMLTDKEVYSKGLAVSCSITTYYSLLVLKYPVLVWFLDCRDERYWRSNTTHRKS